MKLKYLLYSLILTVFFACDDDLDSVGMNIQPDHADVKFDTVSFRMSTIKVDSIYINTVQSYLGEFTDPYYGSFKSSFLSQFYTAPTDVFMDTVINNKIDSAKIILYHPYDSIVGDPLTPMEVSIYPIKKRLEKKYYSNVNPWEYADENTLLGRKIYTGRDLSVPDSSFNPSYYQQSILIDFPTERAQEIYDKWRTHPEYFQDLTSFADNVFPGIYVNTTYGSGNMIKIEETVLYFYYMSVHVGEDEEGNEVLTDSTAYALINVSEEIIQLTKIDSWGEEKLLADTEHTYVKSPAGIFTEIQIPLKDISDVIGERILSNAKFSIQAEEQEEWEYTLDVPASLLLVHKDSVDVFFKRNRTADGLYSYTANVNKTNYNYNFDNISNVVKTALANYKEKPEEDILSLWLIPVDLIKADSYNVTGVRNRLRPTGATFVIDPEKMKMEIVTTRLPEN